MSGLGLTFLRRGGQAHPTAGLARIKFADPEVERICVANFSSDGVVVTYEDAEKVTSIGSLFRSNTLIKNFDELRFFKNVQKLDGYAFNGCTSLEYVNLENVVTTGDQVFMNTTLVSFIAPNISSIGTYQMRYNNALRVIDLGENCAWIGNRGFSDCPNTEVIICRAANPPGLGYNTSLATNSCPIYVPDASVDTYKTASTWSSYASRIKPLSEYQG